VLAIDGRAAARGTRLAALRFKMFAARLSPLLVLVMAACAEPQRVASDKTPQPAPAAAAPTHPAPKPATARAEPPKAGAQGRSSTSHASRAPEPARPPEHTQTPEPTASPLDMKALVQRLQDTKAVGLFTKVALKNQVADLMGQFRAFHEGKSNETLSELRRPYDLLVTKVLALLQDSDPSLAKDIVASREAIWGLLADPDKFANI
jgi:hypothetical protein